MTRVREKQEALLPSDMAKTDYLLMAFGFREALLHKILWRSSNVPWANAYTPRLVTL